MRGFPRLPHGRAGASLLIISIFFTALAGCAGGNRAVKPSFREMEHWEKLAKISRGYSPSPIESNISINNSVSGGVNRQGSAVRIKPLPTQKISLQLHNADVKAILRAMALSRDVNLLVPDDINGTASIDFNEVPWDQAFLSLLKSYGLAYAWQGDVLRVLSLKDMQQDLAAEALKMKLEAASPLATIVVPVHYADAKALGSNLRKLLEAGETKTTKTRSSVLVDDYSNSLIIQAAPDEAGEMLSVIRKIDRPAEQVLIRANIVETTLEEARALGIQWGGIMQTNANGNNKVWITPGGSAGTLTTGSSGSSSGGGTITPSYTPASGATGISQQGFGVNFPVSPATILSKGVGSLGLLYGSLSGNILDMQLQALQTEGKINIISSPSITTLDNQQAFTESGTRVPYVTYTFSGSSTTPTVNFVNAVLKLEITPHIIGGTNLKMTIDVMKDDVDTSREVQGNPFILSKQTQTTLIVRNGETIVISGLTSQNITSSESGVPVLRDIPVLGWLFKGESRDNQMNQVLIFITPYILPRMTASSAAQPEMKNAGGGALKIKSGAPAKAGMPEAPRRPPSGSGP